MTTVKNPLDNLVDRFLQRAGALYSLPSVAVKVLELADDPHLDTPRLKACIENDPALTSRILRVVNSSLFGLSCPVGDLGQALTLLGVKPLKLLVLGFSLPEGLYEGVSAEVLQGYWRHTLTKAVAARELCHTVWRKAGDDAFLIGLLQDLGMLLLIQGVGQPYEEFVRRIWSMGKDLIALERHVLGFDHTAVSARLLGHWRLPEAIVRWISWEEIEQRLQEHASQTPILAQVIHLAEGLARVLADRQPAYFHEVLSAGAKYQGMTQIQLEAIAAELESKVGQLAEVLHLRLPPTEDYRTILVEAHRRLSEAASEAVQLLLNRTPRLDPSEAVPEALRSQVAQLGQAVHRLSHPNPKAQTRAGGETSAGPSPSSRKESAEGPTSPLPSPQKNPQTDHWQMDSEKRMDRNIPASASALAELLTPDAGQVLETPAGTGQKRFGGGAGNISSGASGGSQVGRGWSASGRSAAHGTQTRPTALSTPLSDPGLLGHVKASVALCRNARAPLSLLLAEPTSQEDTLLPYGPEDMQRFGSLLQKAAKVFSEEAAVVAPYGEWGVAMVLPHCDRQAAVRLGNQLVAAMRQTPWGSLGNPRSGVALGVGVASVAMPPKNFPAEDLLEAAARCLFASHASGGGVVKSIEIY